MAAATLLIQADGYITLSDIAETLYVSRATIISDLPDIKEFIRSGNLEVVSHSNKGLRVEGKESDKRWFLFQISAFEGTDGDGKVSAMANVYAETRQTLKKILVEQESVHETSFSDSSFLKVQKYLGIMLSRIAQGEMIEAQGRGPQDEYLEMAQDILKYVNQYFSIHAAKDEEEALAAMLRTCRYSRKQGFDTFTIRVQMVARRFIRQISDELGQNLNDDYEFFENLSNHLESMFRTDTDDFPYNESVAEIAEENPAVYDAVREASSLLEILGKRTIGEIALQYLAVHVCAAVERKKNSEISFHVIVVCNAGIGTSQLLLERLKKHFNFRIVDIVSAHEAAQLEPEAADLIISTVPLKNCRIEYVIVSPLLADEDYVRVGSKIDILRNSRHLPSRIEDAPISAKGLIDILSPIVYREVPEQADSLMRSIRREIRAYFHQAGGESGEDRFAPALHHFLTPNHIQLDVSCRTWEEAVARSAEPMVREGIIEERYVDAMIANIKENGPYIVIAPGFALPHEGLEMGSILPGMNLIRLSEPVNFGADDLDPIRFVCCLSAVDHKTHLRALFHLVNLLGNPEFRRELECAQTVREAARVIEKYENELE